MNRVIVQFVELFKLIIMDEKEIFEDQVADYWIDYYKTVE